MRDKYQNLDLNLLRVLLLLGEKCSATRAAEQLGISQPATSRLLARLRDHFDDQLFVKSGSGLLPTPLASQLIEQLTPLFSALRAALNQQCEAVCFTELDLSLLRLLVVMSQEQSTTRAAKRLHLSQPATSRALGRLRAQLGDELFVKTGKRLKPTPVALQLAARITPLMNSVANVVNQGVEFEPSQQQGVIRIAMPPGLLGALGARLFQALSRHSPELGVQLESWSDSVPLLLQSGELLLAINFSQMALPGDIAHLPLGELRQTRVYLRQGHPLAANAQAVEGKLSITPQQLIGYPLGMVYHPNMQPELQLSEMERMLDLPPQSLRIKLMTDQARIILQSLQDSDLLFITLMDHSDEPGIVELVLQEQAHKTQTIRLMVFTHARNRNNPQLQWLYQLLQQLL